MERLTQGQKLMLLVRDSSESVEDIAKEMGYGRTYLPKLYKMEKMPEKAIQRAVLYFGVPESYFDSDPALDVVNEPDAPYKPPSEQLAKREREIEVLKEELEMMRQRLVEQKNLTAEQASELDRLRRMLKGE